LVATDTHVPVCEASHQVFINTRMLGNQVDNNKVIAKAVHFGKT
jgi:hypothetical protein